MKSIEYDLRKWLERKIQNEFLKFILNKPNKYLEAKNLYDELYCKGIIKED